ncbi:MAG: ABC transporter transmembrane domain-containing protein, partial [Clostridia bacterium]
MAQNKTNPFPNLRGFDMPDGEAAEFIQKMGVDGESVIAAARSDLKTDGNYGKIWLFAAKDRLITAEPESGGFAVYRYDEWELRLENYLTTGAVLAVCGERELVAAAFTDSCNQTVGNLFRVCERLKDGKELSDEDFRRGEEDRVCPKCGAPYEKGRKTCPKCQSKKKLFLRVLGYMPRYKKELAAVMGLIILSSLVGLVRPYLNGNTLYDQVLTEGGKYYGKIIPFVLMMIGLEIVTLLISIFQGRVGAIVSGKIVYDIKSEVFSAMQRLSMSFFNSKHTGSLMNRVNSDALDIQYFLNDGLPQFIINAATIVGIGTIVLVTNPLLALLIMLPIPVIVFIIKKVIPKFNQFKWIGWHKSSKLNGIINDALLGVRVVKAFGKEKNEIGRFEDATQELYDVRVKEGLMSARIFPLLNYMMTIGGLFVWGLGGWQVLEGRMTFGTLMTFVGYISMLYAPINFMI